MFPRKDFFLIVSGGSALTTDSSREESAEGVERKAAPGVRQGRVRASTDRFAESRGTGRVPPSCHATRTPSNRIPGEPGRQQKRPQAGVRQGQWRPRQGGEPRNSGEARRPLSCRERETRVLSSTKREKLTLLRRPHSVARPQRRGTVARLDWPYLLLLLRSYVNAVLQSLQ